MCSSCMQQYCWAFIPLHLSITWFWITAAKFYASPSSPHKHHFLVPYKDHWLNNCLFSDTYPPFLRHHNLIPTSLKGSVCGWVTVWEITFPQEITDWNGEKCRYLFIYFRPSILHGIQGYVMVAANTWCTACVSNLSFWVHGHVE